MAEKILIIGNSAKEHALAKSLNTAGHEVHVAPGNAGMKEFATCADIRPYSISELLDYALENDISLTVPVSDIALKNGITDVFRKNNLLVFAPLKTPSNLLNDKAATKKLLYRLKIPTAKFGIFEKPAMAFDYIKNINMPFVIKTNTNSSAVVLTSARVAKNIINSAFEEETVKIIIEDYIPGIPFCFYAVTDGYKALPIGSSRLYRHALDGDGGQLTCGMGACSPFSRLSLENEQYIIDNMIYPLIRYFQSLGTPYTGILGIEAILTGYNTISVTGITTSLQDGDCQAVLNNIDTDLFDVFKTCVIGSFSDDIDDIPLKNIHSTSVTLNCANRNNVDNTITGLDFLSDETQINFYSGVTKNKYMEYVANYGQNLVLTCSAGTNAYATSKVYNEIEDVNFSGMSFRKDIGKSLHYVCEI